MLGLRPARARLPQIASCARSGGATSSRLWVTEVCLRTYCQDGCSSERSGTKLARSLLLSLNIGRLFKILRHRSLVPRVEVIFSVWLLAPNALEPIGALTHDFQLTPHDRCLSPAAAGLPLQGAPWPFEGTRKWRSRSKASGARAARTGLHGIAPPRTRPEW